MFAIWLAGFSCVGLAALADGPLPVEVARYDSPHFAIEVRGTAEEARELGDVLEAALPTFAKIMREDVPCDEEPPGKVYLLQDREQWLARIRADGVEPPAVRDFVYYQPERDSIYLYRLSTAYQTRRLALEGAFERFHCRCRPKNRDLAGRWIVVGLAEHFGEHQWDGKTLRLGVLPLVSMNDLPAQALARVDPGLHDPERLLGDGLEDGRVCFAVVRYLLEYDGGRYRKRFEKLALGHSGSKLLPSTFAAQLGPPLQHARQLYRWLSENQEPLRIGTGVWEDRGGGSLVGAPFEEGLAYTFFKEPVGEVRVRVQRGAPAASAGIVFGYSNPDTCWRAGVEGDRVVVRQYELGVQGELRSEALDDANAKEVELRLLVWPEAARLFVDGRAFADWDVADADVGLFASGEAVEFRDLTWSRPAR